MFHQTLMDSVIFDSGKPSIVYVIPRDGKGTPMEYRDLPAFFSFHHINSFQQSTSGSIAISVDMSTYKDMEIVQQLLIESIIDPSLRGLESPRYSRLTLVIDPKAEKIRSASLDEITERDTGNALSMELPKVRFEALDRPTRFVYGVCHHENRFSSGLTKVDAKLGCQIRWHAANQYPGEPIFVANPNGSEEDDGAILSVVLDAERKSSYLLVLDAKSFKEIGRAQLNPGKFIIPGFHGSFHKQQ